MKIKEGASALSAFLIIIFTALSFVFGITHHHNKVKKNKQHEKKIEKEKRKKDRYYKDVFEKEKKRNERISKEKEEKERKLKEELDYYKKLEDPLWHYYNPHTDKDEVVPGPYDPEHPPIPPPRRR